VLPWTPFPTRESLREWLRVNDRFHRDILDLLRTAGPMLSRDIPDTCVVPWQSSGWANQRNVTQMLEFMTIGGEVAIAGRQGKQPSRSRVAPRSCRLSTG
jgi:hypothetical protein